MTDRVGIGRYASAAKGALMLSLVAALASIQGCSTSKQFSYLDSVRWNRVEIDTYDTTIVSVDGTTYPYRTRIRVDPGPHHLVFQTKPTGAFPFSPQKSLDIDIQPCMRYWFEGKRVNSLQQDFEPRVNHVERIPGCGVAANG